MIDREKKFIRSEKIRSDPVNIFPDPKLSSHQQCCAQLFGEAGLFISVGLHSLFYKASYPFGVM